MGVFRSVLWDHKARTRLRKQAGSFTLLKFDSRARSRTSAQQTEQQLPQITNLAFLCEKQFKCTCMFYSVHGDHSVRTRRQSNTKRRTRNNTERRPHGPRRGSSQVETFLRLQAIRLPVHVTPFSYVRNKLENSLGTPRTGRRPSGCRSLLH